ncbi:hypothetical protein BVRB_6g134240 [Beta vulgaris subsp. vulgaris]|nr:hypothetical protein BVRB_6g134240 [Beta vulgaris subsp. vulgaris]
MQNIICLIYNFIGLNKVKEAKRRLSFINEDDLCCVCLSTLIKEGEDIKVLPCLHHFHSECVDMWFNARRKTCPICRFLVEDERKDDDLMSRELVLWYSILSM